MLELRTQIVRLATCLLLAGLSSAPVWAIAPEEPGLGFEAVAALSAELQPEAPVPSPMQIGPIALSEAPPTPFAAGQATERMSNEMFRVTSYISNYNKRLAWDEVNATAQAIVHYSNRYGIDYRLLTSLIAVESAFRKDAISSSGAIGMGQLKPDTAKWLGVVNPYDPTDNIAGTARFLAWLVRKYNGNLEYALSGYYQGPGYVDRNGITPVCMPYLEKINRALGGLM